MCIFAITSPEIFYFILFSFVQSAIKVLLFSAYVVFVVFGLLAFSRLPEIKRCIVTLTAKQPLEVNILVAEIYFITIRP